MFSLSIFPFLVLAIYGDVLFIYVFGIEWLEAGIITQIFVIRVLFEIIFSPLNTLTSIIEKQEINLLRSIMNIIAITSALLIGGYFENYYLGFILLSIFQGLVILYIANYLLKILKLKFSKLLAKTYYYCNFIIILGIIMVLIKLYVNLSFLTLVLTLIIFTLVYYTLVLMHDKILFHTLKNLLIKKNHE